MLIGSCLAGSLPLVINLSEVRQFLQKVDYILYLNYFRYTNSILHDDVT